MSAYRLSGALLLFAIAAAPCSMVSSRKLWGKSPGSSSRLFAFERDGRIGFIDSSGRIVVQPRIEASIDDVGDFAEGLARVRRQGYIDELGNWVVRHPETSHEDFSEGLAMLTQMEGPPRFVISTNYIDRTGAVVVTLPGLWSQGVSEGLAAFEAKGKKPIRSFKPGNFLYMDFPGLKGFIDRAGRVAIPATFADVGRFVNGLARASVDGYCHLATPEGAQHGSPTSGYPTSCGGAPADAVTPCATGFIDRTGSFSIRPRFESARDFQEGLAAVRAGGLWGFINPDGEFVIEPRFEQTQSFREGLAAVKASGKWGFIDRSGAMVIHAKFEGVEDFSDSVAIAYRSGRPFFIDRTGRTIIATRYREVTPFVHGLAAVLTGENQVSYIEKTGRAVFSYVRKER